MSIPKVLIACEESQRVCIEFRRVGCEAYSCDLQKPSGGYPEWHILGDAVAALAGGVLYTMDGQAHDIDKWDMIIAFPPCTDLAVSGARWFQEKQKDFRQQKSCVFFMRFALACCDKIAVENPIGIMSTVYRKPDQIIQPYQFGNSARKSTCLWLKNLPPLFPTKIVDMGKIVGKGFSVNASLDMARDEHGKAISWNDPRTAKARSKTFPGIANAMAEQWGKPLVEKMKHFPEMDEKEGCF